MASYPIQPTHISTDEYFWDTFGNRETEVSARCLVRLAKKNGDWRDFSKAEIDEFNSEDFCFNRLFALEMIRDNGDETYSFTHEFITTCFLGVPAIEFMTP